MSITREEIEHVAQLARLQLSEAEKDQFTKQLSSILDYISQLNEVNTENIEPTAQVSGLLNVWREDEVVEWDQKERRAALEQSELEDGQIKVKRVL